MRSRVILPVNEWALILATLGPFLLNPVKRNPEGSTPQARGGCFLASPALPEEGSSGRCAGPGGG